MIPDNYDRFKAYEEAQTAKLMRRPECICCHKHIQDDFWYEFPDGWVCDDCVIDYVHDHYARQIDDD